VASDCGCRSTTNAFLLRIIHHEAREEHEGKNLNFFSSCSAFILSLSKYALRG